MSLEMERIKNPVMEFYRHVYSFSKRWNGTSSLDGKKVIVYCEQGYGDIIQFLRYIKPLKALGCEVFLHAPVPLHPLLNFVEGVDHFFDKQCSILPQHDFHILSLSLPFLLGMKEVPSEPYMFYPKIEDLKEHKGKVNIGIAWEGSPEHPKNFDRCCPLKHFGTLVEEDTKLFMLQQTIHLKELTQDVSFDLFGAYIGDFGDTAALINAVDFVVTVDTSILHLAGAMGKRTYGILSNDPDPRWSVANWYDSVTLIQSDLWENVFNVIKTCRKR